MSLTSAADLLAHYFTIPAWLPPLWEQTNTRYAILLLVAAGVFALMTGGMSKKTALSRERTQTAADNAVKRPTNTALWRRLWWRIRPPVDLMRIDGLTLNRSREPHAAWLGPTGGGKSASVATVRVTGERPTFIVTPDTSDPLRAAAERIGIRSGKCFIWTACQGWPQQPVDFLIGSPTEVAERLTEAFRSGGVGAWKRSARMATAEVIRRLDDKDEPRSLKLIGQHLQLAVQKDRELKMACAGWVARFLDLADQFGDSIAAGGVDLAKLLKDGYTILLDNDAFEHPGLVEDVVALGLSEAKRAAAHNPKGFRLIFEEAGQIGERIELAAPFFRAGRRRRITVDVLTQAETDLEFHGSDAITSNIATHVYFAQKLKSLQKIAADRLGLPYTDLDPANMADFHAFISHGRIRRLVHFPKPPGHSPRRSYVSVPIPSYSETPAPRRIIIEEVGKPVERTRPALPPPSAVVQEILEQFDRSGDCWLWTGPLDKDGYGYARWNGNNRGVHRITWELAYGPIPSRDAEGNKLELDHTCRIRHCGKVVHLELVTKGENVRRMWAYRARKGRAAI